MAALPGKPVSLWLDTAPATNYPKLRKGISVDVAVIGGGIAGVQAAWMLKAAGKTVAVIEASRLADSTTGNTTGKVSSLQGLAYQHLKSGVGSRGARIHGEANQAGIAGIEHLINELKIECDWTRDDNYTFAEAREDADDVRKEAALTKQFGLPASYLEKIELPVPQYGAVRFSGQAKFHAVKYVRGLAEHLVGSGSHVFEQTRALDVKEGKPCRVITDQGELQAKEVIVATNLPFLDRGLFFARTHPYRSYLIATRLNGLLPRGMYLSSERITHSLLPIKVGQTEYLLVGGEGHKAGQGGDIAERYRALETYARKYFDVAEVTHRWATQDAVPVDYMPYVGKLNPFTKHIYVAAGFRKWGLSNSYAAAVILRDTLTGQPNPWAASYNSNRISLGGSLKLMTENFDTGIKFLKDRLKGSGVTLADLVEGEGKIVRVNGKKVAAYKDDSGTVQAVSPICTHLQCVVDFNNAEKTWDCPCHGSRFAVDGSVIQGPATKPLSKKSV